MVFRSLKGVVAYLRSAGHDRNKKEINWKKILVWEGGVYFCGLVSFGGIQSQT